MESWKSSLKLCSTSSDWRVRKGSALMLKCKDIRELISQNCFFLLELPFPIVMYYLTARFVPDALRAVWGLLCITGSGELLIPAVTRLCSTCSFGEETIQAVQALHFLCNLNLGLGCGRSAALENVRKAYRQNSPEPAAPLAHACETVHEDEDALLGLQVPVAGSEFAKPRAASGIQPEPQALQSTLQRAKGRVAACGSVPPCVPRAMGFTAQSAPARCFLSGLSGCVPEYFTFQVKSCYV